MSKTPLDLDALRAAVLMSRKPVSNPSPANEAADQPNIRGPTRNVKSYNNTASKSQDMSSATNIVTSGPRNSEWTPVAETAETAVPARTNPKDKEDGEISDDDIDNIGKAMSETFSDIHKGPSSDHSANNIERGILLKATTGPSQHNIKSWSVEQPISQESSSSYPISASMNTRSKKKKEAGFNEEKHKGDVDFNVLMAEYQLQKAKTDSRMKSSGFNHSQAADSEIPGFI
ncbi:hypothetical protein BCR41DRAFT_226268 [Lobosporangium transversale]|uniref:Uncharacterized protein n=1 Tax=Lobosporangium transversale TaxID=64571 RepID=A0A1Y2G9A5_9FUNG|nr:hypothetical protein BCR41DRAFT_226268 [Lobosporangium transversale]ORY98394.1 hypothetical protein BCR41DRAFT_226268 [Lobosporangium transversale]|eukprot:XP_021875786.1 hypothetical protein BCR41DRAFT_226268 [Lobosporangium transversale]